MEEPIPDHSLANQKAPRAFFLNKMIVTHSKGAPTVILIVASKDDAASWNIASKLIANHNCEKTSDTFHNNPIYRLPLPSKEVRLLTVEGELVDLQELSRQREAELIVFISRHESRSGTPILSVHVPGNLGDAEFGGLPHTVSIAPANAMRSALRKMAEEKNRLGLQEFAVYYEGTHHGPSLDIPSLFVEIGSTAREWTNPQAGEAVAEAAMAAIKNSSSSEPAVSVGGSHCNRRLTSLGLESKAALGHIIPSHAFKWLTPELIQHCIKRTLEKDPLIILDWKGIDGKDREKLQTVLENVPYRIRRVADYREEK
jgi:D-aminoacyl-tRNA deacylase